MTAGPFDDPDEDDTDNGCRQCDEGCPCDGVEDVDLADCECGDCAIGCGFCECCCQCEIDDEGLEELVP